jgi:hypothetical protein
VKFCYEEIANPCQTIIAFTNESLVMMNPNKGGIWRRRGEYIAEEFRPTSVRTIQVMVWCAIFTDGRFTQERSLLSAFVLSQKAAFLSNNKNILNWFHQVESKFE